MCRSPPSSVHAAVIDKRLACADLAPVFGGIVIVDALNVIPLVSGIRDDVVVNQNKRHAAPTFSVSLICGASAPSPSGTVARP